METISFDCNDMFDLIEKETFSVKFRFLHPGDQAEVKSLCQDWFPVLYPDRWYNDIVHDKKYFALAAYDTSTGNIIGLIISTMFPLDKCNYDDKKILHKTFSSSTLVCYILVLGVVREYRRYGLASILLDNLLNVLEKFVTCKVIYLHVLHSNNEAIEFYKSNLFQYHSRLPYYYLINGKYVDAFCFVRYINGGYPQIYLSDIVLNIWKYIIDACHSLHKIRYFN